MPESFTVGSVTVETGRKKFAPLTVGTMANGSRLLVPVHVLAGSKPGPKLCVVSTQHGDEIGGIDVARQIVTGLDPQEISGTLAVIPVANPLAFEAQSRWTTIDGGNLNRSWPGHRDLFVTDRIADIISREVLSKMEYVIDLHSGEPESCYAYSGIKIQETPGGRQETEDLELAMAFGTEIVVGTNRFGTPHSVLHYHLAQIGVRGFTVELGDSFVEKKLVRDATEVGVTGIKNIMKHVGMLDGEEKLPKRQVFVQPEITLQAANGGMMYPEVSMRDLGTVVPKGTLLGRIMSPYTFEEIDRITALFDETIILAVPSRKVRQHIGGYTFILSDWKNARWFNH
jgi:predicted deacylase